MLGQRLREILSTRDISKEEFAEKCDLPIETVRNIYYGKTNDPKISTVMKMAEALGLSVNCLMGQCQHTKEERALLLHFRMCGHHGKSLILLTAKYEALSAKDEREAPDKHKVPCLLPNGEMRNGIIYDNCEIIDVITNIKEAFTAIKMPTNDFAPIYCKNDIILIENKFPANNECAVFYKDGKAYIRKFLEEEGQYRLKCLHRFGEDIIMKRMDQIEYIGTCCGVIRS